jgi:hypothetical protein
MKRFPLALLALLATTLFLPALIQRDVFTLRDHFDYFQPLRSFTAEELKEGRLPFWNPYNAAGEPWLANPQTGVFYPPAWLFLVLPFETAYMLFLLLHLILLGWGAFLLFARNASAGAAMAGAAALMFSGPVLSLLDVQNNLATLAWIPLVLWCACEGAWRRGGFVLALAFLGGEPFFAALAALLYVVVRRNRDVLWTGAVAFGISAIQLLPFLAFVIGSDRAGGMEDALILRDSMPLLDWYRVVVPGATGQQFIPVVYMGVVVVVLAVIGAAFGHPLPARGARGDNALPLSPRAGRGWRAAPGEGRRNLAWLALLATSIFIATGPQFLTKLPLTLFRYPARLIPVAAIAVAALAVAGWERIRGERRWVDLVVTGAIVADLLLRAMPLLATAEFRRDVVPYPRSVGADEKFLRFGEIDPAQRANWIAGYLNLYDRRFDAFTAAPLAGERYVRFVRQMLAQPKGTLFSRAGIAFMVTKYELPSSWVEVAHAGDVTVYRNPNALPMAAHFSPGTRSVRFAPWTLDTSTARISVNAPRDGILVLRQQAAKGWSVTLDGKPATPLVVDEFFRGVSVPKGRHEVVWTYDPPLFFAGCVVTLITLLAMQIHVFVKRVR